MINIVIILVVAIPQIWGLNLRMSSYNPLKSALQSLKSGMNSQIFCNVELNANNLEAVGFDMDFTLAQYNTAFDLLAFEGAKNHLYNSLKYPKEVLDFQYSSDAFCRGLVIDKKRGNVLKVDRHKYVRQAYHGMQELSRHERKQIYTKQVATFTESNYVNIDTIFLVIDALLFGHLVELKKQMPDKITKSFEELYKDLRSCVDLCHRDGVIKDAVMKNPEKYIVYDANIVPMLRQLKDAGKKVFLLTNSLWDYTNVVMGYLVHGGGENKDIQWEDLFDCIIVGACKPAFLTEDYISLYTVDREGNLYNVEDKDSLTQHRMNNPNSMTKVYQGGHWQDLHKMLEISFGDKILYVGDHMYSDILRSKRTLGWRTCLIIPELENEIAISQSESRLRDDMLHMRQLQYDLDEYIDLLRKRYSLGDTDIVTQLEEAENKGNELKETVRKLAADYDSRFNKNWGQLFKAGFQDSRFAKQVLDYACLYTSKASNLASVSPNRPFRPVQDFMPHDQVMFDSETVYSPFRISSAFENETTAEVVVTKSIDMNENLI